MAEDLHNQYKIVLTGSGGTGKSCITNKFLTGFFTDDYDPTIGEYNRKESDEPISSI
jgi:GTPase SAR1 family protein